MFTLATVSWPEAFMVVGVVAAIVCFFWIMAKYTLSISPEIKISDQPMWTYDYEEKPVKNFEEDK